MLDIVQVVLLFVISTLTILLVVVGIQVFFILKDLRQTIAKANKVLDDTGVITESLSGPVASLSALAAGIKTGASVANILKGKRNAIKRFIDGEEAHE